MMPFKRNVSVKRDNTDISTILFTNARDEPNIAEWVAHHLLLGFDQVVVFDHQSVIPITTKIGTTFDNRLAVLRVKGQGNIKIDLMKNAVNIATRQNKTWMLYLDADEFLCLNMGQNIKEYLNLFREADAVGVNWLMYGTSGHKTQPQGLLTENFVRSEMRLNKHVKSFIRPETVKRVVNPHYYILHNPSRYYSGNGTKMVMGPFNDQPLPFIKAPAYIAHYYTQSEQEHARRKTRILDDGSKNKQDLIQDLDTTYNQVVNNQLQNKYSENIKGFLQHYGVVL